MFKYLTLTASLFATTLLGSAFVDAEISVVGRPSTVWDKNGGDVSIDVPANTEAGDLLVLILHRSDYYLPIAIPGGWKRGAECFKTSNGHRCARVSNCVNKFWEQGSRYCEKFEGNQKSGDGQDLAQTVFFKEADCDGHEPISYKIPIKKRGGKPTMLVLATLRGADTEDPLRDWAARGKDGSEHSAFPAVKGKKGDFALLSMSFEEKVAKNKFKAPSGFKSVAYRAKADESAFLFGRNLQSGRDTSRTMTTRGDGDNKHKDALVSMTIKERPSNVGVCEPKTGKCKLTRVKENTYCATKNGGCRKALVYIHHYRTCKKYCESQDLVCVGAWEDKDNGCAPKKKVGCKVDFVSRFDTSDALCECAK